MRNSIKTEQEFRDLILSGSDSWRLDSSLRVSEGFVEEFIDKFDTFCFWNYFSPSHSFFDKHFVNLVNSNTNNLLWFTKVPEDILEKYSHLLNKDRWLSVERKQTLSEAFIEKFAGFLNWDDIFIYQKLSFKFIKKWEHKINDTVFSILGNYQKLSIEFFMKNKDRFDWGFILENLTIEFARTFRDLIKWDHLDYYTKTNISEEFIDEFRDKLSNEVLRKNTFVYSEAFMERNLKKKVPFSVFLYKQPVSIDFILRHSNKLNKKNKFFILNNKKIKKDVEFWEKLGHLFEFSSIPFSKETLQEIIKKNLHKFDMDKFIADVDVAELVNFAKYLAV